MNSQLNKQDTQLDKQYTQSANMQGFLKKKNNNSKFNEYNIRWFEINTKLKIFGYKTKKEDESYSLFFKFSEIVKIEEPTKEEIISCDWKYGFTVVFKTKQSSLFAETKEQCNNWITALSKIVKAVEPIPPINIKVFKFVSENFLSDKQLEVIKKENDIEERKRKKIDDDLLKKQKKEQDEILKKQKQEEYEENKEKERLLEIARLKELEEENERKRIEDEEKERLRQLRVHEFIKDNLKNNTQVINPYNIYEDGGQWENSIVERNNQIDKLELIGEAQKIKTNEYFQKEDKALKSINQKDELSDWNFYKDGVTLNPNEVKKIISEKNYIDKENKYLSKEPPLIMNHKPIGIENILLVPSLNLHEKGCVENRQVVTVKKKLDKLPENATELEKKEFLQDFIDDENVLDQLIYDDRINFNMHSSIKNNGKNINDKRTSVVQLPNEIRPNNTNNKNTTTTTNTISISSIKSTIKKSEIRSELENQKQKINFNKNKNVLLFEKEQKGGFVDLNVSEIRPNDNKDTNFVFPQEETFNYYNNLYSNTQFDNVKVHGFGFGEQNIPGPGQNTFQFAKNNGDGSKINKNNVKNNNINNCNSNSNNNTNDFKRTSVIEVIPDSIHGEGGNKKHTEDTLFATRTVIKETTNKDVIEEIMKETEFNEEMELHRIIQNKNPKLMNANIFTPETTFIQTKPIPKNFSKYEHLGYGDLKESYTGPIQNKQKTNIIISPSKKTTKFTEQIVKEIEINAEKEEKEVVDEERYEEENSYTDFVKIQFGQPTTVVEPVVVAPKGRGSLFNKMTSKLVNDPNESFHEPVNMNQDKNDSRFEDKNEKEYINPNTSNQADINQNEYENGDQEEKYNNNGNLSYNNRNNDYVDDRDEIQNVVNINNNKKNTTNNKPKPDTSNIESKINKIKQKMDKMDSNRNYYDFNENVQSNNKISKADLLNESQKAKIAKNKKNTLSYEDEDDFDNMLNNPNFSFQK